MCAPGASRRRAIVFVGVEMTGRCVSIRPNFRLSRCSAYCFFHCAPLFLRRRLFSRRRKTLHCNWRTFSIVDRLYFFPKIFWTASDCTPVVRHETRDWLRSQENEMLWAPAWLGVRKPSYAITLPCRGG